MGTYRLIPHPDNPPKSIQGVEVRWLETADGRLILRYQVNGAQALRVPEFAGKGRADELWRTTCLELFVHDREGAGYAEFNFSPSERWAAYHFTSYRDGRTDLALANPPEICAASGEYLFVLTVTLDAAILRAGRRAGLCAVIEENDGTRSYWAIAHPAEGADGGAGGRPGGALDFHAPACFAIELEATGAA